MNQQRFDVIIAGGGSAGCAAAAVLSREYNLSVCLLEAGPDYGPFSAGRWPSELLDARYRPSTHDWGLRVQREGADDFTDPRARVIGGCSAHNECAAIWGLPQDYDDWAKQGNLGWSYKDLQPLIQRIEGLRSADSLPFRGRNGPLWTQTYPYDQLSLVQRSFIDVSVTTGFPHVEDISDPEPAEGVSVYHANVKDSVRWNAAFAFLDPVRDLPNLTILPETLVDKLIVEGSKAVALACTSQGEEMELRADVFLVCAGAYGSPAILLRSGIGPPSHLQQVNVPVKVDLEGVGRNLHDHHAIDVQFHASPEASSQLSEKLAQSDSYTGEIMLKADSGLSTGPFDLHILPAHSGVHPDNDIIDFYVYNMVPRSRGEVTLASREPDQAPRIASRYLTDSGDVDLAVLVEGYKLLYRLVGEEPLASALAGEVEPWDAAREAEEIDPLIRQTVDNYSHAVGTCKMGPDSDPEAVVDPSGRVVGLDNLYVADASIMPMIPRANTNLTSMLIGMKVADVLGQR